METTNKIPVCIITACVSHPGSRLFSVYYHCLCFPPAPRGQAGDWYEALHPYLLFSSKVRRWFVDAVFLQHRERFCEYLLESPSAEVAPRHVRLLHAPCCYMLVPLANCYVLLLGLISSSTLSPCQIAACSVLLHVAHT